VPDICCLFCLVFHLLAITIQKYTPMNRIFLRLTLILTGLFLFSHSIAYTIKSDEIVTFFPSIAYPVEDGKTWLLHIHGWIYEPQWGVSPKDDDYSLFKKRAGAFFVDNERGKQIAILLGGKPFILKKKSAPNGHFSDVLRIAAPELEALRHQESTGYFIAFKALTPANDSRLFEGKIQAIDKTGISVISDIDDTIKISEVRDKWALLANTFMRPFQPVPNMAKLYSAIAQQERVTFHYVSASPWQLYQPLHNFLTDNGFPAGSFHLRLFRWKDSTFFNFFKSSRDYKIKTIQSLIDCCLGRRFILVGDSGENDPEIYASIARQYPVVCILIRDWGSDALSRKF